MSSQKHGDSGLKVSAFCFLPKGERVVEVFVCWKFQKMQKTLPEEKKVIPTFRMEDIPEMIKSVIKLSW